MALYPKLETSKFLPGLEDQHVVGATGVGICVLNATLACNTARTAAELIASPPNTSAAKAFGPVVHSLGKAPTLAIAQQAPATDVVTGLSAQVGYQFCTADNSAVYFWASTWTGTAPAGVATRVIVIP